MIEGDGGRYGIFFTKGFKVFGTIIFLILILIGFFYVNQRIAISNLDKNASEKYLEIKESLGDVENVWLKMVEMKASGESDEEIAQARLDFFGFYFTALLLEIELHSSLSDIEKKVLREEVIESVPNGALVDDGRSCPYIEEVLLLPDMFDGAVIKFSEPMLYLDWPEQKGCSPIRGSADYILQSVDSWDSIIFDKSEIEEIQIDPNTTFVVEKKILVRKGGMYPSKFEHYVLRDSNGVVSVPAYLVFDMDYSDEDSSGSYLYRDGEYIGHLVADLDTDLVYIEEDGFPAELLESEN